jgi:hypothetical protein
MPAQVIAAVLCCGILGLETEDHHDRKEGLNSWVTKTHRRDALAFKAGCLLRLHTLSLYRHGAAGTYCRNRCT